MASPITNIRRLEIPEEVIQEHNLEEVVNAVSENKEAILTGIDTLVTLSESGILDMANAFVKHRKDALEYVMREVNKPAYSSILENASKLVLLLGELPVDDIQYFTDKLKNGMDEARTFERTEKTSYMSLLKALKDPEINKSITMLMQFLRGMGKE